MSLVNEELTASDVQASRATDFRAESKIWFAPDGLSVERAVALTSELARWIRGVKIHDLLDDQGPNINKVFRKAGARQMWIDYKLHDVPKTVGLRARALARNGANVITVQAGGGIPMMEAAIDAVFTDCGPAAEIWAITLLTSLGTTEIERDFGKYGNKPTAAQIVLNRAIMAKEAGIRTIVCSAEEVGTLKQSSDLAGMKFTVPGARSLGVAGGGQKRSGTPAKAIADGADFLVVASQVTDSADPVKAFKEFATEIGMRI